MRSNGILIERKSEDNYVFTETPTGEELVPTRGFWFAWAAFNPDTILR